MPSQLSIAIFSVLLLASCSGYSPAGQCPSDASMCQLPSCKCCSASSQLNPIDMPQIVMLSFNGAIEAQWYQYYQPLFSRTNPDGCPIGITFFLSHDYTDYSLVNNAYNLGHEIASNSISLQTSTTYWMNLDYQGWIDEMYGLKQIASYVGKIPMSYIKGTRIPNLQPNGDVTFSALDDSGFTYDSTLSSPTSLLYPYTMDYSCTNPPFPFDSFPGFWEVPLSVYNSTDGPPCDMLDACPSTNTINSTFDFLLYNFNQRYNHNRAPFGINTDASWFMTDPTHYQGYLQFVDYLGTLRDVYVMTVSKTIAWMQHPTPLSELANFVPWSCAAMNHTNCYPISCYYPITAAGGERYMVSCAGCPQHYPWVGDPYGNASSIALKKY